MRDVDIAGLAGRQFNRVSRAQLLELGLTQSAIEHRLGSGKLVIAEEGVYAVPPLLAHDDWGLWMGATLTAPESVLSHQSAAAAGDFWTLPRRFEAVTRPGSGGPRMHGRVRAYRSSTLDGEVEVVRGIPVTKPARTLLDLARITTDRALARALREAVRLGHVTIPELIDYLVPRRRRKGARHVLRASRRYSGLPIERARSGAEVRALEILRDAKRPAPRLNVRIAGEEADLSWPDIRLIVEIDGGPFHLDVGEDERKQLAWEAAGWTVLRLPSDDVYEDPQRLLALAPA
jgi:hypothetical protein